MNEELKKVYKSVILKYNKTPFQYEKRENAQYKIEAYNPVCGDRHDIYLDIENDTIKSVSFHGYGCAISKASTSVLVENMNGKSLEEVKTILKTFEDLVNGENIENAEEDLKAFVAAKAFPGRELCATLSWDKMMEFINELKKENA